MRKGFTLSEALVSLAVIAVLASIIAPIALYSVSDQTGLLYKSAFKTIEEVSQEAIQDTTTFPTGTFDNASPNYKLCNKLYNAINVLNWMPGGYGSGFTQVRCTGSASNYTTWIPNWFTTNGMAWYGFETPMVNDMGDGHSYLKIQVDVDGYGRGANAFDKDILGIRIRDDGKVTTEKRTGSSAEENLLLN